MSTFRFPLLTSVVVVIVLLNIARIEAAANQCINNTDCRRQYGSRLKYCCRVSRNCGSDCVGNSCRSSTDCAPGECCLNNKCRDNCVKISAGGIAGIVIGVIVLIAIPLSIIACCCCCCRAAASSGRPANRGVILSQPGRVAVVTSQNAQSIQAGPGYPAGSFPSASSYPGVPVYPAPLQNPALYNPYPQKPAEQELPPQQAQGPPPAYSSP